MSVFELFEETFRDPITFEIMDKAVITPYGHSFSESSIWNWLNSSQLCPLTHQPLRVSDLRPNFSLRSAISVFIRGQESLKEESMNTFIKNIEFWRNRCQELMTQIDFNKSQHAVLERKITSSPQEIEKLQQEKKEIEKNQSESQLELKKINQKLESLKKNEEDFSLHYQSLSKEEDYLRKTKKEASEKKTLLFFSKHTEVQEITNKLNTVLAQKESISMSLGDLNNSRNKLMSDCKSIEESMRGSQLHLNTIQIQLQDISSQSPLISEKNKLEKIIDENLKMKNEIISSFDLISKQAASVLSNLESFSNSEDRIRRCSESSSQKELGNLYFKEKNYSNAINVYSTAISKIEPYFEPSLHLNRAAAFQKLEMWEKSIDDCDLVLEKTTIKSTQSKAHRRKATAFIYTNQNMKAVSEISKALNIDEEDKDAKKLLEFVNQRKK